MFIEGFFIGLILGLLVNQAVRYSIKSKALGEYKQSSNSMMKNIHKQIKKDFTINK